MSASQPWMMSSKVFDRWLISSTDMPTPGSDTRSRCASSSTSTGSTAGPAEKLNIRVVVELDAIFTVLSQQNRRTGAIGVREQSVSGSVVLLFETVAASRSELHKLQIQYVAVLALDLVTQRQRRLAVEVDPRHRRLRPLEDDVLRLLHVQVALPQVVEHVGQHPRTIAVPHHEHVRGRRAAGEIDDVRHAAGLLVAADDAHRLRG